MFLFICFNLKRDASPVATMKTFTALVIINGVSISSEMPAPWRPLDSEPEEDMDAPFQSQARCQPRGDHMSTEELAQKCYVSISSEMPAPWRRVPRLSIAIASMCFNLKRDASPVATYNICVLCHK